MEICYNKKQNCYVYLEKRGRKMKINTVGVVLSHYRKKYQLSQTQICEGICGIPTYCRIEKGYREVDSLVSQSLVERLGKQVLEFELLLNKEDYERMVLRNRIKDKLREKDLKAAENLLEKYQRIMPKEEVLHKQFFLCGKAQILLAGKVDKNKAIEMLREALNLTKPGHENGTEEQLYSGTELKIAYLLAVDEKDEARAEKQMRRLLHFIEKYNDKARQERFGLPIVKELIQLKKRQQEEETLIEYLDEAIAIVSESNKVAALAGLHFDKAEAMEHLFAEKEHWGEKEERPQHLKDSIRECLMAYQVADTMEYTGLKEKIRRFSEEKLGWRITE